MHTHHAFRTRHALHTQSACSPDVLLVQEALQQGLHHPAVPTETDVVLDRLLGIRLDETDV